LISLFAAATINVGVFVNNTPCLGRFGFLFPTAKTKDAQIQASPIQKQQSTKNKKEFIKVFWLYFLSSQIKSSTCDFQKIAY